MGMWIKKQSRGGQGEETGIPDLQEVCVRERFCQEAPPPPTSFLLMAQVSREQQAGDQCSVYQAGQLHWAGGGGGVGGVGGGGVSTPVLSRFRST